MASLFGEVERMVDKESNVMVVVKKSEKIYALEGKTRPRPGHEGGNTVKEDVVKEKNMIRNILQHAEEKN